MKKNGILTLKIVLVVGLVSLLFVYKKYQNWVDEKWEVETPRYVMEDDDTFKEDVNLINLYKRINYQYVENNLGSEFKEIYYGKEKFNDKFYIYISIIPLIEEEIKVNCNINRVISGDNVDDMVKKMFGKADYSKIGFEFKDKSVKVEYNNLENSFNIKTTKCSGIDYTKGGVKTEYIKASQGKEMAYIEENVYYMKSLINSSGMSYNYHSGVSEKDRIISNELEKIDKSKLPVYRLVFIREGENYYFRFVEKR